MIADSPFIGAAGMEAGAELKSEPEFIEFTEEEELYLNRILGFKDRQYDGYPFNFITLKLPKA